MPLVGPRLQDIVDDAGARLSKFRGIVAGLNCDFLERIHARLALRRSGDPGGNLLAIEPDQCIPKAVDADGSGRIVRARNELRGVQWITNAVASSRAVANPQYGKFIHLS